MKKTAIALAAGCVLLSGCAKKQQPNIVFILADDLGWNDLGCTGSDFYETPNIDRIASEGILFTRGYAACQVSSPSRASILTGQYTVRHGITDWIGEASGEAWRRQGRHTRLLPADYAHSLPHEEVTLAEALRSGGYSTFIAGKWHLGGPGSYPEDHGFDINIGGYEAGNPGKGGYFSPYFNPKLPDGPAGENLSHRLGRETADFIRSNASRPFFAYLSFYAVHGPIQTTEENWRYFRDRAVLRDLPEEGFVNDRRQPVRRSQDNPIYAGVIREMDDAVGMVLDALREEGLEDNTIVIFTSDNGGVSSGDNYSTSCLPLRGGKGRQWEGGFRVPLLIRMPGGKRAGSVCDTPVSGIDFYPTLLSYAGIRKDPAQVVDGVNIRPLLEGGSIAPRPLFWHYPHYGNQGGDPSAVVLDGDWKLIHYFEDSSDELYNLSLDISEAHALNELYPQQVERLHAMLMNWLEGSGAILPEPDPKYDAEAEERYLEKHIATVKERQEDIRRQTLQPDYRPNADWWGSQVVD